MSASQSTRCTGIVFKKVCAAFKARVHRINVLHEFRARKETQFFHNNILKLQGGGHTHGGELNMSLPVWVLDLTDEEDPEEWLEDEENDE